MELYKPSATLFLDTRKAKSNNKYPLKLTVYCKPEKKRYKTGIDLTREEWEKINGKRLKDDSLKETKLKTQLLLQKAEKVLEQLSPFSFSAFETSFYSNAIGKVDLSLKWWFDRYIQQLEVEGREGTRIAYQTTRNSLADYKPNLKLTDITKEFLQGYETHMKKLGRSSTTTGIYMRQLRSIINQAIDKGVLKQENYPFKSFEVPGARNVKKALSDEQLQLLLDFKPATEHHKKALDFWIMSYLCNGMNMVDILHLTPANISGSFLFFIRQKTIRTKKRDLRPIKVPLHQRAKDIIDRWKSDDPDNPYLFPVLEANLSPKTVKHRTQRFIKWVNEAMNEIRKELKIEQKIRTYEARHSHASRLLRKGASVAMIKENLGHSSVAVTENYLGDFADSVKIEFSSLLTDF
ncbi:MAG TPA: site-specific integrase [Flavisolibacter sp.]|jgi:integrase|nr:site-specific integrase [Flavisolibacter sp.]